MRKKIIRSCLIVLSVAVVCCIGLSALLISLTGRSSSEQEAKSTLDIYLTEWEKENDPADLVRLPRSANFRISVIAAGEAAGTVRGTVLADSHREDPSNLENHWEREEVAAAAQGTPRTVIRYSATERVSMLYYARLSDTPSAEGVPVILRVAIPISHVDGYFLGYFLFSIVVILLMGGALLLLWLRLSRNFQRPLNVIRQDLEQVNNGTYRKGFVFDEDEEINAIMLQIRELADRIDASLRSMKTEKRKLDFIVDHLKEGIIALNAAGEVVLINARARKLFDFRAVNLGRDLAYTTSCREILDAVSSCKGEIRAFDILLKERIWSVTVTSAPEESAEIPSTVAVLSDVTDKRKSEEMREEFFANASHEFKTPVTSIRGFSELMADEKDPERLRKYASRIHADSTRIMNLLTDMLKLTKLDQSYEDEEKAEADLRKLCEEIGRDFEPRLAGKRMAFSVEGERTISCYPNKVRDLVSNLIDNAVKYSNPGGAVRVKLTDKYLSVSDDGIGIEKKYLSRIFERFFMVDQSRSKKEGGTGLGLSIVKHICRVHNWTPRIESRPGVGTTVTVVF